MRQAEYESSQSQMESMQGQTAELNYQLRESADRIALLTDELAEARREQHARSSSTTHSADDAARVLALTEARFEAKIAELQNRVHASERERNDGEAAWSRKLDEKTREVDDIRRRMEALVDVEGRHQASLSQIRQENERLHQDSLNQRKDMAELRMLADKAAEAEVRVLPSPLCLRSLSRQSTAGEEAGQASAKITALEEQLEEIRSHEAQLKTSNKVWIIHASVGPDFLTLPSQTLRDELRKVQSSVARFERQRAPGVGYWSASRTTSSNEVNGRTSLSSTDLNSPSSPRLDGTPLPNEEDVNLEYLRNVILQFLEHKEMRVCSPLPDSCVATYDVLL
jgi:chromosome segregation ATPase